MLRSARSVRGSPSKLGRLLSVLFDKREDGDVLGERDGECVSQRVGGDGRSDGRL